MRRAVIALVVIGAASVVAQLVVQGMLRGVTRDTVAIEAMVESLGEAEAAADPEEIAQLSSRASLRATRLSTVELALALGMLAVVALVGRFAVYPLLRASSEANAALREALDGVRRETEARQALERRLLDAATREQERIGRELHDGACQELAGALMILRSIPRAHVDAEAHASMDDVGRLVRQALTESRRLAEGLHPVPMAVDGLAGAIEGLGHSAERSSGVPVRVEVIEGEWPFDSGVAVQLYRIAQESLANAARHADAREIVLRLESDAQGVTLSVSDDGRGFDVAETPRGLGLTTITYRAASIGATLELRSVPDEGTTVRCSLDADVEDQQARDEVRFGVR